MKGRNFFYECILGPPVSAIGAHLSGIRYDDAGGEVARKLSCVTCTCAVVYYVEMILQLMLPNAETIHKRDPRMRRQ